MIKYVFADTPLGFKNASKVDPMRVGQALEDVGAKNGGNLHPNAVVDAARDPDSPLHPCFEWDDGVAAEMHRRSQARALIRAVRTVQTEDDEPVRRFWSVRGDDNRVAYRSVTDILASSDLQKRLLMQADKELSEFSKRYRELQDVCAFVLNARERIKEKLEDHVSA
jgi:hypothetical protein